MKEGVKKSISLILVLTLLVQLLPVVAFGVGDETNDLDISTDSETVSMKDDDAEIVGEEDALRGLRFYQERFGKVGYLENRVYPGVAEMLQTLVDAGCTLAVATSKPAFYATRILEHFALDGYFAYISGSEMDGTNGAKSAVVARAMQEIGADPAETAMVGDRRYDMQSAREAGLAAVGAGYGYADPGELEAAGAEAIAADTAELTKILLAGRPAD